MSRFRFELAGPEDDAGLRRVLAETPTGGDISVRFLREPSWFAAAEVEGHWRQVVACRSVESGEIIGFGSRSLRNVFVNGQPTAVGYLSNLRLLTAHRNRGLVARGYAYFRTLHADGAAPFYLTTIAEGNRSALEILTSGRAGLPTYRYLGRYQTFAISLRSGLTDPPPGVNLCPASLADLPDLLEFLRQAGQRRQFFPEYSEMDFVSPEGRLRELSLERVVLAKRNGKIVGTLAAWDQIAYRQNVVEAYGGWIRWVRPLLNLSYRARGLAPLPNPGTPLKCLTAAIPVVENEDPQIWLALLRDVQHRFHQRGWSHLLQGLHEADPLSDSARRIASSCYVTNVYLVYWDERQVVADAVASNLVPYLELGSL